MGNYVSCSVLSLSKKASKSAIVIFPGGEVRRFSVPVKAAELMMECPNFFLTNSKNLHMGRRFPPLGADDDIEKGSVYIMFPMKRVSSIATSADIALAFMGTNIGNTGKITPAICGSDPDMVEPVTKESSPPATITPLEGMDELLASEYKYRLSVCGSKKPSLETIKEEPRSSR